MMWLGFVQTCGARLSQLVKLKMSFWDLAGDCHNNIIYTFVLVPLVYETILCPLIGKRVLLLV